MGTHRVCRLHTVYVHSRSTSSRRRGLRMIETESCSMLTQTIALQLENRTHFHFVADCGTHKPVTASE